MARRRAIRVLRYRDAALVPAAAVNDNEPVPAGRLAAVRSRLDRVERRMLMPAALLCLCLGLAFTAAGIITDSAVIGHAARSSMVFGFVGLRRAAGFGPETPVDASP